MAFPATTTTTTHAKRDAIVLQASRGFASAPNSPRVFLQSGTNVNKRSDIMQLIRHADKAAAAVGSSSPGTNVESMLQRICSLFPTAREYDVRELLIKYHYREAVVVSALQVLKYPLTMPGPASVATPPARHLPPTYYVPASLHAWSETMSDSGRNSKLGGTFSTTSNTPLHSPLPNRPITHSPKIKLKYLKSVFPAAEENFLLDLLVGMDNNVNTVTQQLLTLGHQKKDKPTTLTPRRSLLSPTPSVVEREPVVEEEEKLFVDEEEAVIQLALESSDYHLEKAQMILSASQERDESFSTIKNLTLSGIKHTVTLSSLKSSPSCMSTFKDIANLYSPMKELDPNDVGYRCKPTLQPITTPTSSLYRGTNQSLLGENYVTPNGPQRALANGPNGSLRRSITNSPFLMSAEQRVTAQGPNPSNRHGPKVTPCTSLSSFIADKFQKESMRRL
ncbi:hypothetical protein DAPPUDRAFT_111933 [Daphnia pulex]|uniref:CUE domain-containing protein n=1 Tax=Daphnia pulex TaxID=6669 RepID=E9HAI3_DAPPU|nr:hypothetical protein DAPPUDRAFT_111933 [Daphnia pulex]|eukprot:EFX71258.1 hypothetical protein DAPPUDRAFT_111933 [Daphnia pulex]